MNSPGQWSFLPLGGDAGHDLGHDGKSSKRTVSTVLPLLYLIEQPRRLSPSR